MKPLNLYFSLSLIFISGVLISPFILIPTIMDIYINSPMLWLWFIIAILLLFTSAAVFYKLKKLPITINFNRADILIILSLVLIVIKRLTLDEPFFTDKVILFCGLTFVYFTIKLFVSSLNKKNIPLFNAYLTLIILIVICISCLYGILQLYGIIPSNSPFFRVTGPFHNPARYAIFLVALLPYCLSAYLFYPKVSRWYKIINIFSMVTGLMALLILPATNTRAAWIGLLVSSVFILYYRYKPQFKELKKKLWLVCLGLFLCISVSFLLYKLKPRSAESRLAIWEISFNMVKENPITGVGYGNFENRYDNYQAKYFSQHQADLNKIQSADVVRYAYNIFLQILCEQGMMGLILFIILLYCIVPKSMLSKFAADQQEAYLMIISFAGIIAIVISGISSYPFDIQPVICIFFIHMAILSGVNKENNTLVFTPGKLHRLLTGTLLLMGSILLFLQTGRHLGGLRTWGLGITDKLPSEKLTTAYTVLKGNINFIDFYSTLLLREKKYKKVISALNASSFLLMYPSLYLNLGQAYEATGDYQKAEESYLTASNMVPNKFTSKYFLAKFYLNTKQFKKSAVLAEHILAMPVKIPSQEVTDIRKGSELILIEAKNKSID